MKYFHRQFSGERALFNSYGLEIDHCLFLDGESPLKESSLLKINDTTFAYKYPLWYCRDIEVNSSIFMTMSRSGLWYSENVLFNDCKIFAPKEFRHCKNVSLNHIDFTDASETLWNCKEVTLNDIKAKGDYFMMNCEEVKVDHLTLDGNYLLDGGKNILVTNSLLHSKDAFWNCEHVEVENCVIEGEYLGWNSSDVTLKHCKIISHQGLCYIHGLTLIDCEIVDSDLIFEYCDNIDASVNSFLDSVKNPISGKISCLGIKELIQDDKEIDTSKISIITK